MILQACAKVISWCAQLIVSACEHVDTIPYSDQHAVALLIALSSWTQHTF